ncbi:MAG: S-adenosyl-l-methionine hydroxide adenosyltransferase family protein [Chitinispirillaceae bacterium]|nr:S-adenosyl-l-methionine hydroxide adenosyltransferase family protein [Chitinispirillaceae bacterium]
MSIISLITDFGLKGWYVAEMKAAILSISPSATIIDITHEVPACDIRYAAFTLNACFRTFPKNTLFCVVVDPGVGSSRKALVIKTENYFFIGPDNGVFSWALRDERDVKIRTIENQKLFLKSDISSTFNGRDIFAPITAHLANGISFDKIGPEVDSYQKIPYPIFTVENRTILAEIVFVDHFGNLITSVKSNVISEKPQEIILYTEGRKYTLPFRDFFAAVEEGHPLIYIGSAGYLEIGINKGNAAEFFNLKGGDYIKLIF